MDMMRHDLKNPIRVVCFSFILFSFLSCSFNALAWSDDESIVETKTSSRSIASVQDQEDEDSEDEYNFSWLDPDKKVYVLQNRKYRKSRKFSLFLSGGMNFSNPYKSEFMGVPRLAYWFAEQFGIEAFYSFISNSDSDNLKALKKVSASALPFVREHKSYVGGLFSWVPWYAKLNFFNKILYLDWSLNAGIGQVSTSVDENNKVTGTAKIKNESFTAFYFGTAQNYYLTRNFSVRLDLIGLLYSAKGADNETTKTYKNFDFTAGIGYLF